MNKRGDLEIKKFIGYIIGVLLLITVIIFYKPLMVKLSGLGSSLKNIFGLG